MGRFFIKHLNLFFIKKTIDSDYQIIGFSFSSGYFNAKDSERNIKKCMFRGLVKDESINQLFENAAHDNFIFNVKDMGEGSELYNWFTSARDFLTIGAVYTGENIYFRVTKNHYDIFIHYSSTNESTILNN